MPSKTKSKSRSNSSKNIPCPDCGKLFRDNYNLSKHRPIHSNSVHIRKQIPCPDCKKLFVSTECLKKHRPICTKVLARPFGGGQTVEKCTLCDHVYEPAKSANQRCYIRRVHHFQIHRLLSQWPVVCLVCNTLKSRFVDRGTFAHHFKKHHPLAESSQAFSETCAFAGLDLYTRQFIFDAKIGEFPAVLKDFYLKKYPEPPTTLYHTKLSDAALRDPYYCSLFIYSVPFGTGADDDTSPNSPKPSVQNRCTQTNHDCLDTSSGLQEFPLEDDREKDYSAGQKNAHQTTISKSCTSLHNANNSINGNTLSCIKQEVDFEEKVVISPEQQLNSKGRYSVGRCTKVKKEEEGVECKVEWDGDECDCLECRVEREIKIEFNQTNATANQRVNLQPGPSNANKGASQQCKRVKKEEEGDDDGEEWDEDCDCGQCRRMRQKVSRRGQTNATENQGPNEGDGGDDGEETEVEEDLNKADLLGNGGDLDVDEEDCEGVGELDEESDKSENNQEGGGESQMSCEDDETEIDDEEFEMDVDGEESSNDDETEVDEQADQSSDLENVERNFSNAP